MSGLSYLEKLLDGVGVEWKALEDVTSVLRGKRLTKNLLSAEEKFPVFHGGLEPLGYYNKSNRPANTVMIINVGASAGTVGYSAVEFWSSDGCFCLEHNKLLNNRFLYFALIGYQNLLKSKVRVAGIPTLDAIVVNKLLIPIPCPDNPEKSLAIQSEIVRILDTFTALTNELTNELKLRRQQYNYYREQLLSFKEGEVEWRPLGKLLERTKGTKITAGQMKELHKDGAPIKIFAGGKTIAFVNFDDIPEKNINREPSIIVKSRGIIEFEYYDKPFSHKNEMWAYHSNNYAIHIKYIYYFMKINEYYFQKIASKMQMPQIATPDTDKFKVPIPYPNNLEKSLAFQSEIVRILDKFDTLTNSISEGLPLEIELRKKQYEHYRDLLFSFPKPVNADS
ncbi:restriction endonuclease subunit S [Salmonella enterica]|nr:restriction endonuclease subunit S [Salmonella enterica]EGA2426483.1 restriction endonuclease subunit S [Salmonella enterica]EGD2776950.1 restriction endonuclease subunit S [Salmonella enterica]EGH4835941.1 restriction endonuclease subunit S [Salmonella enterica]EHR2248285.1 restriction endonuclease subunit S [Salmonella enterica]